MANARPALEVISRATDSAAAISDRVTTAIAAPASARSSAIARPILRAAPVTMATAPSSSLIDSPRVTAAPDVSPAREAEVNWMALHNAVQRDGESVRAIRIPAAEARIVAECGRQFAG